MDNLIEITSITKEDKVINARRILAPYFKTRKVPEKKPVRESRHFTIYLQKKPLILLQLLEKWCLTPELLAIVNETASTIRESTMSAGCRVYLVDTDTSEIYQITQINKNKRNARISYRVAEHSNVAAYVAHTKQIIKIDDLLEDTRFPTGLGYSETTVKAVICVPVLTPENECLAVVEIHREIYNSVYNDNDLLLVIVMSKWMGASIYLNQQQLNIRKEEELNSCLLDLTKCYFTDIIIKTKLVTEFINLAKNALYAEHCMIYIIKETDGVKFIDSYEDTILGTNSKVGFFKKVAVLSSDETDSLIISIREGQIMNIKEPDAIDITKMVDRKKICIRSLLCYPINCSGNILGSLVTINKVNQSGFQKHDETLLKIFADYCGLALEYAKGRKILEYTDALNQTYAGMVTRLMQPCKHDIRDTDWTCPISFHFYTFDYFLTENDKPFIPRLVKHMFKALSWDLFKNLATMKKFILIVNNTCKDLQYHNIIHAFHSCHCVFLSISYYEHLFTATERTAMLIAAFCHDIDHKGYSNTFLELTNHYLADLYDAPIMKNHNFFMISFILQGIKVFDHLPANTYKELLYEIETCTQATDIGIYIKNKVLLSEILIKKEFNMCKPQHKSLLKGIIMAMGDFADFCKNFPVVNKIAINLQEEYHTDAENLDNNTICPMLNFDKTKKDFLVFNQMTVMELLVIPCARILAKILPKCDDFLIEAMRVHEMWEKSTDDKNNRFWTGDIYYSSQKKTKRRRNKHISTT